MIYNQDTFITTAKAYYDGRYLYGTVEIIGQDWAGLRTQIRMTIHSEGGNKPYYGLARKCNFAVYKSGQTFADGAYYHWSHWNAYGTTNFPLAAGTESFDFWVPHNADGTMSVTLEYNFALSDHSDAYCNVRGTDVAQTRETWVLPTLKKDVQIVSAPNFTDEDNPTVSYVNSPSDGTASLVLDLLSEDAQTVFASRNIPISGTSYTMELTDNERDALRTYSANSKSCTVVFRLISTLTQGKTFTSTLKKTCTIINAEPSVRATLVDTNSATIALTGNNKHLVRYYSNAQYEITATAYKKATIAKLEAENGTTKYTTASGTFNDIQSDLFEFSATDSRGYWRTAKIIPTFVPYVKLTCNFEYENPTPSGELTCRISGNYFNGSFGAVNNTLSVQYRIKVEDEEYGEWITPAVTLEDNSYIAEVNLTGLDYQTAYTFQARASDKLNEDYVYSAETYVKSLPVFHWGKEDFVFEVPVTFNAGASGLGDNSNIEGDLNVTGDLRLKGTGNYGNTLYFGDKQYCYLKEGTDDDLTIHASDIVMDCGNIIATDISKIEVEATKIIINGNQLPEIDNGTWTPELNSSIVSSYAIQRGWWSRVQDVVTLGFMIVANCNSGYTSTPLEISGIPFTCGYPGFGGGFCSGAYITGGYNFQGWSVNENGTITGLAQPCNNTYSTALTVYSSVYYGSSLSLGGTICYRKTAI